MDRISLIFCIFSLIITLGLAALIFPYAVLPVERLVTNGQSVEAAEIPDINLGDFGVVSVSEMLDYYIENPPIVSDTTSKNVRKVRIQGC